MEIAFNINIFLRPFKGISVSVVDTNSVKSCVFVMIFWPITLRAGRRKYEFYPAPGMGLSRAYGIIQFHYFCRLRCVRKQPNAVKSSSLTMCDVFVEWPSHQQGTDRPTLVHSPSTTNLSYRISLNPVVHNSAGTRKRPLNYTTYYYLSKSDALSFTCWGFPRRRE